MRFTSLLFVAASITWMLGCQADTHPEDVALAELVARQADYDGRTIRTRGIVRTFDTPRHYWLEDDHLNRVGLMPAELIAPHLDRQVTIVGQYSFASDRGRRIAIDTIAPFEVQR